MFDDLFKNGEGLPIKLAGHYSTMHFTTLVMTSNDITLSEMEDIGTPCPKYICTR